MLPVDVIGPLHDLIQYLTVKSLSTRRVEHCISVAGGDILRDSNCIQALKPDAHQALWAYRGISCASCNARLDLSFPANRAKLSTRDTQGLKLNRNDKCIPLSDFE